MAPVHAFCSVGVAFHTTPGYPTQWTFVISRSEWFQGKVWVSTLIENTGGRGATSMFLDWSPACLNQSMLFTGIVKVAESPIPFNTLKDAIPMGELVSKVNPSFSSVAWEDIGTDSEKYVGLILSHLCENRYISVPGTDHKELTHLIRGRLENLHKADIPRTGKYPVLDLTTGNAVYGDTRLFPASPPNKIKSTNK
ncbi:hypothetical protein BGW80DRAFT_123528 [Lactifluus volemus]|nr:hypothetical protein BGW80DRAFT_123528 [Lactifluus volemus]